MGDRRGIKYEEIEKQTINSVLVMGPTAIVSITKELNERQKESR